MKEFMKQKAYKTVNGIFHFAFLLILSLFIFSSPGYGSSDIPVKVDSTPVAVEEGALFAGFGSSSGLINQEIYTVVNGDIATTSASTLTTVFHGKSANVYTETPLNLGTENDTTTRQCHDSCSL